MFGDCGDLERNGLHVVSNHADKIHCLVGDGLSSLQTVGQERKDGFVKFSGINIVVPYVGVTDEVGCTT
jgi:hypothetical protein